MIREWFKAHAAVKLGTALADQFAQQKVSDSATHGERALQEMLQQASHEIPALRLNIYKRAKFANSFKWRLLENGVEREIADEVTQRLVLHLSMNQRGPGSGHNLAAAPMDRPDSSNAQFLFTQGNKRFAEGAYAEAFTFYRDLVELNPHRADALNNLGSALCKLGRYKEAEDYFRQAIEINANYPEAHNNLGNMLRLRGHLAEAEISLRRALKLKPNYVDARNSLGLTLVQLGRLRDAKARFAKVLKSAPRYADGLLGLGQVASMEGRFDAAETLFKRVLDVNPRMPSAMAALAGIRKMTSSDAAWLAAAEKMAASGIAPLEEADLRFAIGKYHDDVRDFARAFQSYKRANELQKAIAENYDRKARTRFVDDLIRVYSRDTIPSVEGGASASTKPVFVVGMMRSGTSLAEQIIASHPAVKGAGELGFWSDAARQYETVMRQVPLDGPTRKKLADEYLRALATYSVDALRIVDKAPVNSDYLGIIHSVFPNARIVYMRRDPIDTCLSCYFQQLSPSMDFSMDLSDLAHYYREHQRLTAHWRTVLPPGTILDVPYEELIADQEGWTRKILDFLGLEWDERCLDFHKTKRPVVTASYWQVRQRIYKDSVERWRNYEKFIGPLKGLRNLDPWIRERGAARTEFSA
jgi:tetratricopeptide (TPR) repeat protein